MPAIIRTELKDNSKEWSDELKQQFNQARTSANAVGRSFDELSKSLDVKSTSQYQGVMKELVDQLDRASPAIQQMEASFARATGAIVDQGSTLQALGRTGVESAQNLQALDRRIAELDDAMDTRQAAAFEDQLEAMGDAAQKGANKTAGYASSWSDFSSKLMLVQNGFELLKQGVSNVGAAISTLAGAGVPAFQKLTAAGGRVQDAFIKIGENPGIQRFAEMIASAINEYVVPAVEWVAQNIGGLIDTFEDVTAQAQISFEKWKEFFGIGTKGKAAALQEAHEVRIALREQSDRAIEEQNAKRQQERERQKREALDDFADPGKKLRQDVAESERVGGFDNADDIEREIAQEKKLQAIRVEEANAKQVDLTEDRDIIAGMELLTKLEERRLELLKDINDAQTELQDDQEEFAEEWETELDQVTQQHDEIASKQAKTAKAAIDQVKEQAALKKAAHEQEMADQQEEYEKFKKFLQERQSGLGPGNHFGAPQAGMTSLGGTASGGFGQDASLMQSGMDDGDAAVNAGFMQLQKSTTLIKKRQKDALEKWRKEQKNSGLMNNDDQLIYEQDAEGVVKRGEFGNKLTLTSTQRKAKTRSAEARIKKEARRGFRKDVAKGNIKPTEIAAAGNDAVAAAVAKVKSDGTLNDAQLNLLEKMTDELKNANSENARHEEALKALFEALSAGQNQRGSGRQNNVAKAQNTN